MTQKECWAQDIGRPGGTLDQFIRKSRSDPVGGPTRRALHERDVARSLLCNRIGDVLPCTTPKSQDVHFPTINNAGSPPRLFHRRFSNWIHSNNPHLDWIGLIWFRIRLGTLASLPGTVLTSPENGGSPRGWTYSFRFRIPKQLQK
ncbi:hypothetical protein PIB30_005440 [Stylosanthes scabra]|uniref:Uncharacterized protein n=1 Tax=Stylosanthes scabra TaxID=79078 RepID=A0ABU6Y159_9FABA|nr:hypothetical protein [Stylosanthes scabra]